MDGFFLEKRQRAGFQLDTYDIKKLQFDSKLSCSILFEENLHDASYSVNGGVKTFVAIFLIDSQHDYKLK